MTTLVSGFVLALLAQLTKNKIYPKWGATGVHAFIFIVACIAIVCWGMLTAMPSLMTIAQEGLTMLASAITLYEVLLSKIGFSPTGSATLPPTVQ